MLTLAALVVVLYRRPVGHGRTHLVAHLGPGHFVNSLHLWSTEIFFAVMVVHLWGKFLMAAWRGSRALTWVTGVVAFVGSIGTAFTGYLSQTNFDAQWISTQAKDGLNSVGIGAVFNVLNPGQMLMWHITLLPFVVGVIAVLHVVLVRRHGVVPPHRRRERCEGHGHRHAREADGIPPDAHAPTATTSRPGPTTW